MHVFSAKSFNINYSIKAFGISNKVVSNIKFAVNIDFIKLAVFIKAIDNTKITANNNAADNNRDV